MAHGIFHTSGTSSSSRKLIAFYLFLAFFAVVGDSASNEGDTERLVPWQPNPSRRGALAILESCIFTIVACTWSIQHLNVPAPTDRPSAQVWRKIGAAVLTVLMPETMLSLAIVERAAAIQSLQELKNDPDSKIDDLEVLDPWTWRLAVASLWTRLRNLIGCCSVQTPGSPQAGVERRKSRAKWTLTHSYYANMGGLRLGTSGGKSVCWRHKTIALTTRQFGFLRKTDVIKESPRLSEEEILDKSKTDFLAKGIAVLQISELMLSLIARAARHLAISQLEIITVAFAVCAVVTYCFSWNKPQNVKTATTIFIPRHLSCKEERDVMELEPKELLVLFAGTKTSMWGSPFRRIRNGSIELSDRLVQPVSVWLTLAVMIFGAIHLAAWNFAFPSQAERIMWRTSSTAITSLPLFSLLNSVLSSKLHSANKEVRNFQNSVVSLWEDYSTYSNQPGHELPFPNPPLLRLLLSELVIAMPARGNGEQQVAALRTFVSTLPQTPWNQLRTENFEWFMTDIMERRFEARRQSGSYVSRLRLERGEIWQSLKKKAGRQVSTLDRAALFVGENAGVYILLATGFLYLIFRIGIIVLALVSLRSMPDSVYDTTWAKNIPSIQ